MNLEVEDRVNKITDMLHKGAKYAHVGFWFIFVFLVGGLALSGYIWFIVKKQFQTGAAKVKFARFLLIGLGVIILILWIVMFITTAGSAALSASCGFVIEVNKDNREVLKYFNLSETVERVIEECVYSDSEGDLNRAFNPYPEGTVQDTVNGYTENMYQLFEGIATYLKWQPTAT